MVLNNIDKIGLNSRVNGPSFNTSRFPVNVLSGALKSPALVIYM